MERIAQRGQVAMATKLEEQLARHNVEIFAQLWRALKECNDEVQDAVKEMLEIVNDAEAEPDEKQMALDTIQEALFPTMRNGHFGVDLNELNGDERQQVAELAEAMDSEEATFSERVETLLKEREWTQEDLANAIGMTQPGVSMMLARKARPQKRTVRKVAEAFDVPPQSLWPGFTEE